MTLPSSQPALLLADIRQLIDTARRRMAMAVNQELSWLYWQVGRRIQSDILQGQRAEYGKQVVARAPFALSMSKGIFQHLNNITAGAA